MNSWKVILATMVIFGTGVITGGLLVKNATGPIKDRRPKNFVAQTNQPPLNVASPQILRMEFLLRARNELNLTPEQHEHIEKIIREGQEKSRKVWDGVAPELRKELQSVHEKIRAELTPDQRRRFELLLKNSARPNNPENNPALRERLRQGNSGEPPFNPNGQLRPPRRDNFPPMPEDAPPVPAESRPSP